MLGANWSVKKLVQECLLTRFHFLLEVTGSTGFPSILLVRHGTCCLRYISSRNSQPLYLSFDHSPVEQNDHLVATMLGVSGSGESFPTPLSVSDPDLK